MNINSFSSVSLRYSYLPYVGMLLIPSNFVEKLCCFSSTYKIVDFDMTCLLRIEIYFDIEKVLVIVFEIIFDERMGLRTVYENISGWLGR